MPRVQHPKVIWDRVIIRVDFPDTTLKRILMVEVDMPLEESDPKFNPSEFEALVQAVQTTLGKIGKGVNSAEIKSVSASD